jgi:hypothetical protein
MDRHYVAVMVQDNEDMYYLLTLAQRLVLIKNLTKNLKPHKHKLVSTNPVKI